MAPTWSIQTELRTWPFDDTLVNVFAQARIGLPDPESFVTLALVADLLVVAHVLAGVRVLALVDVARTFV